ncbi:MAG: flagellar FlbD family protein [Elusimicrobia bacterium]|nr:flagellar FlbD family protein [Elusimicrobiota bacterium]
MVKLHKLNGAEIVVNAELIESIEPGQGASLLCLATGNKLMVCEGTEEVVQKVIEYRRKVNAEAKTINPIAGFKRENV